MTTKAPERPVQLLDPSAITTVTAQDGTQLILVDLGNGTFGLAGQTQAPATPQSPLFSEVADDWWRLHAAHLAKATRNDYGWRLRNHVLPWFGGMRLDEITIRSIDEFRAAKLSEEQPLGGASLNKMIMMVGTIFEFAIEGELAVANPASGRKRRVKVNRKPRTYLESAEQIETLLEAASQLDAEATERDSHIERRAIVATLVFAGLRIGEVCDLKWGDVDFEGDWLHVRRAKTTAGIRQIRLRPALTRELSLVRERSAWTGRDDYVFAPRLGKAPTSHNVRKRVVIKSAQLAETMIGESGGALAGRITPHSLRRTFASLLFALGEPHPVVMLEMGHTTAQMTLGIYAHAMRRSDEERSRIVDLVA